ncbi:hypothetical protein SAMN05443575_2141 [Jatrophihabitans endophyticus]|uniref:Uncharacterized protein n=1 Tax=Jatrophihabitans endophyticus TaxID=1206085 RepID=A0A1M5KHB2_9ACTN|nr:hypothetical protein [Jatrophihabitans endophyticus]SHG51563.1 hypothetical protein SAMN05443575_2141 [Jatrophihabitans endophyticus]
MTISIPRPALRTRVLTLGSAAALAVTGGLALAPDALAVTKLSQAQAASQLSAAGITHSSSGGCTTRSNSTCTSYEQINQSTVDGAVTLKRASGCAINISGGTEVGHASGTYSHYNGYKIDISKNSCINGYITGSFTRIADRGDGYPQWRAASGNVYCDEGSHWDITYY